jgi:hypothetical protein
MQGFHAAGAGLAALCLAFAIALGLNAPALAQTAADAPQGDMILTITQNSSGGSTANTTSYSLTDLQALKTTSFSTSTMWTEGEVHFDGILLKSLLNDLGVTEGTLIATAINDYRVEIPIAEITDTGPIIAYAMNGAAMPVRDKGPLWIVYPYDSHPDFQTEVVFSRSIWQLNRLEIAP